MITDYATPKIVTLFYTILRDGDITEDRLRFLAQETAKERFGLEFGNHERFMETFSNRYLAETAWKLAEVMCNGGC